MKAWREAVNSLVGFRVFAKTQKSKFYETENGNELINNAEFTGDKIPSSGDPSKKELSDWRQQSEQFKKDKKNDDEHSDNGSPVVNVDTKRENVEEHMKGNKMYAQIGEPALDWRKRVADFNMKKKPDGTFEVSVSDVNTQPVSPKNDVQPIAPKVDGELQPLNEEDINGIVNNNNDTQKTSADVKEWTISKTGDIQLVGRECVENAGIFIYDGGKLVESSVIKKEGHAWREVVAQGVWESKLSKYLASKKKL